MNYNIYLYHKRYEETIYNIYNKCNLSKNIRITTNKIYYILKFTLDLHLN